MASVKGNILLNGINTATSILFPIITFPYAARVLLPEGIGVVNFLYSIIQYIVLLTSIGIPLYAVKEIAKYRDDYILKSKITIEILLLHLGLCLGGYIVVWMLGTFVPQIHRQVSLFYILSLVILFNAIGVEWFYKGVEDFKYITLRGIIIRTLFCVLLFVFVKQPKDILIYGFIVVGTTVGNNFINFIHLRTHISVGELNYHDLQVIRHLRPALHVFILNLIISLYAYLNTLMLGFFNGNSEVGFFTAGTKIPHIGLSIISSIGAVLLPRCTNLLQQGNHSAFGSIISKSARFTIAISIPIMIGLIILARPIINVFCGAEYNPSIPVLYLNAPVIIFIGLTNVIGLQVLYPQERINTVILSVLGGALVNIVFNILLLPSFGAIGAAIATLLAEITVFILQFILGKKYLPFKWRNVFSWNYIIASIVMGGVVVGATTLCDSVWLQLIIGIIVGVLVYSFMLFILRDQLFKEFLRFIKYHY